MLATSTQFWDQIATTSYAYVNATGPYFWLMIYGLVAVTCAGLFIIAILNGAKIVFGYRSRGSR